MHGFLPANGCLVIQLFTAMMYLYMTTGIQLIYQNTYACKHILTYEEQ